MASRRTLDLADNDPIVEAADPVQAELALASLSALIRSARGTGAWDQGGLGSSAAAANRLTGLAVMINSGLYRRAEFAGQAVDENCILVKYTWNGDINLDGKVDASDYFRVDSGYLAQVGGYANGDLNYDGRIDAADYFLIDSAFLGQGGVLAAKTAEAIVSTKAHEGPRRGRRAFGRRILGKSAPVNDIAPLRERAMCGHDLSVYGSSFTT